jgi:adenine-specific DNA-methyltransferase
MIDLRLGDCLEVMPTLADNSVDLILTDPPYYKVKGEWWDRQWDTPQGFLDWLNSILAQMHRVLKPNGSLYLFASPKMAARVEVLISEQFNVIQHITWRKPPYSTKAEMFRKEDLRSFFPASEEIIFAEQKNGDFDYRYSDGTLHYRIMQPIRDYLNAERERAGVSVGDVDRTTKTAMASHWFTHPSQWVLPTKERYEELREVFSRLNHGGSYLEREYEDLRREYEDLRREYEDLRRPFSVTADVPYTDVWDFSTVSHYPGKHPCEKPPEMLEHIIKASSRPGATVLDCFMGTGSTGKACEKLGRNFIGIEIDPNYFSIAQRRIEAAQQQLTLELV